MRKKSRTTIIVKNVKALAPANTISLLSYVAGALFVAYVCCVLLTVYFATLQTDLVASVRDTEGGITMLERTYYDGVEAVSSTNPLVQGYVRPTDVHYATEQKASVLTFAGR